MWIDSKTADLDCWKNIVKWEKVSSVAALGPQSSSRRWWRRSGQPCGQRSGDCRHCGGHSVWQRSVLQCNLTRYLCYFILSCNWYHIILSLLLQRCSVLWKIMMNLWYLRKSSRSSCPMVISCQDWVHTYFIVALCRWHGVVRSCVTEMNIIEEYERNLQFEERYISSVVEGLDDAHIICPVCRMSVCLKSALTFNNLLSSLSQQLLLNCFWLLWKVFFLFVMSGRRNLNISSDFISCLCGLYLNTKVCLQGDASSWILDFTELLRRRRSLWTKYPT